MRKNARTSKCFVQNRKRDACNLHKKCIRAVTVNGIFGVCTRFTVLYRRACIYCLVTNDFLRFGVDMK